MMLESRIKVVQKVLRATGKRKKRNGKRCFKRARKISLPSQLNHEIPVKQLTDRLWIVNWRKRLCRWTKH